MPNPKASFPPSIQEAEQSVLLTSLGMHVGPASSPRLVPHLPCSAQPSDFLMFLGLGDVSLENAILDVKHEFFLM